MDRSPVAPELDAAQSARGAGAAAKPLAGEPSGSAARAKPRPEDYMPAGARGHVDEEC